MGDVDISNSELMFEEKKKSKRQLLDAPSGKKKKKKKKGGGIKLNSKIWQTIVLSHSPREEESMLFEEKKDIAQSKQAMDSKHNHPHAQMDNAKDTKKKKKKKQKK